MKRATLALMMGSTLGIAGCSSSDTDETIPYCTAFGIGATYQWTACNAGCTFSTPANAFDFSLNTSAIIVPLDGQTTYTTKLTATAVDDIASGAVPGVFLTQPTPANFTNMNTEMRTILDGVEQEVLSPANEEISLAESRTPATGFLGMRTTQPFDTLELTVTMTWTAGQVPNYYVYEICADGGNV